MCMPGNVLVDTKEKLMQIQGYGNANSGIGIYLPSQEATCTCPVPVSQHMHSHGTSPAVGQQGKGPMQALWHTRLHAWQAVLGFKPPESTMRFLSEIFSQLHFWVQAAHM